MSGSIESCRQALDIQADAVGAAGAAGWVGLVVQSGRQYAWPVANTVLSRTVAPPDRPLSAFSDVRAARRAANGAPVFGPVGFVHLPVSRRRIAAGAGVWPGDLSPGALPEDGRPVAVLPDTPDHTREVQVWLVPADPAPVDQAAVLADLAMIGGDGDDPLTAAQSAVEQAWDRFLPDPPSALLGQVEGWPPPGVDDLVRSAGAMWVLAAHGLEHPAPPELLELFDRVLAAVPVVERPAVGLYVVEQVRALGQTVTDLATPAANGGAADDEPPVAFLRIGVAVGDADGLVPELFGWWNQAHIARTGHLAVCAACDTDRNLTLITRSPLTSGIGFVDLVPVCRRCAALVIQLIDDRTAVGGRWERMPRQLQVDAAIGMVLHNRKDISL